jgi:hypothetical protein
MDSMKTPGTILTRIILYLIILAVGTYVLCFILEMVAIPIPPLQTYFSCPEGTTVQYTWVQESWDSPGEKTMERGCIDQNGKNQDTLPDEVYSQRQYNLFMPISFAIMFIGEVAWVGLHPNRKKGRAQKESN